MNMHKRALLTGVGLFGLSAMTRASESDTQPRFIPNQNRKLVCVYLRGGADVLSIVVPKGDKDHATARSNVMSHTDDLVVYSEGGKVEGLPVGVGIKDFFGLHPQFTAMLGSVGEAGALSETAFVLPVGSHCEGRSHFSGQAIMEAGRAGVDSDTFGWLGRWLNETRSSASGNASLRAFAIGNNAPHSLSGGTPMVAPNIRSFGINYYGRDALGDELGALHADSSMLGDTASGLLAADAVYDQAPIAGERPQSSAIGRDLQQVADLLVAGVGEVYTVDMNSWDTHANQLSQIDTLLGELCAALQSFYETVKANGQLDEVTVVVMSEFGRRIQDNGSGTDHGTGGMMMVMGGGVKGGIYGEWPGLIPAPGKRDVFGREYRGDLLPTIDYRQVLCSILERRMSPNVDMRRIFPEYDYTGSLEIFG